MVLTAHGYRFLIIFTVSTLALSYGAAWIHGGPFEKSTLSTIMAMGVLVISFAIAYFLSRKHTAK